MAIETNCIVSKESLKKYFGYDDFRNTLQQDISRTVFEGRNDVYLNLPPGHGKSLCFQLPTVLKSHTVSVVFVPRDILAKDQILFLQQRGFNVDYVCTRSCKKIIETKIRSFTYKKPKKIQFLYVLVDKQIMDLVKLWIIALKALNALSYIVFDEAHCVSSLSHDYVPAYKDAAELVKKICPKICKIALTATATTEVRREIIHELDMKNIVKFRTHRHDTITANHDVHFIDTIPKPLEHLFEFIAGVLYQAGSIRSQVPKCGIIFCRTKKTVKEMVTELKANEVPAVAYHGAMSLKDRESIHERWANGKIFLIVTTHTFGIGLHKPNVRFVIHWNLPLSFQQLYQESGRVSEDGEISYCRVYYSYQEEENITTYLKTLSKKSGECVEVAARKLRFFEDVINYCLEVKCRHVSRSKYFGKTAPPCHTLCDACTNITALYKRVNECRKYRTSMKSAAAGKLPAAALLEAKALIASLNIEPNCTVNTKKIDKSVGPTQTVRYRSLNRLILELMANYDKHHEQVKEHIKMYDVTEIARRLENSLYNGAQRCSKYNHDVVLAIFNIRKASESGSACIHFTAQGKHVVDTEAIDIVDMASDSSSESESESLTP